MNACCFNCIYLSFISHRPNISVSIIYSSFLWWKYILPDALIMLDCFFKSTNVSLHFYQTLKIILVILHLCSMAKIWLMSSAMASRTSDIDHHANSLTSRFYIVRSAYHLTPKFGNRAKVITATGKKISVSSAPCVVV